MNQISRLIAKLCPLGVGFQLLGNLEDSGVVKLGRGNVISKTDLASSPGDYPVYSSSAAGSGEFGRYGKFMFEDERITWSIDGGGRFFYRSPHNYSVTNVCGWLKVVDSSKISTRFLFHVLTGLWETKVFDYTKKAHPSVIREEYLIPLPPIEIQIEIVRILDAFTELTTELTAELTARKKQYNYYRDQLLSFEEGVPLLALSQCCESIADGDHQAPQKTEDGIPFITISDVSATNQIDFSNTKFVSDSYYDGLDSKRKARTNDILYTVVGSFGIPVHIDSDKKFAFQRHIAILRPNPAIVISKYMYHALRGSHVEKQAHSVATGAAQKTITLTALNRMQIAVPSLEEQARIVAILDKFDALTNSITEGLPREIELRQKQYEYYRDLLLSFPKPEAPTVAQA